MGSTTPASHGIATKIPPCAMTEATPDMPAPAFGEVRSAMPNTVHLTTMAPAPADPQEREELFGEFQPLVRRLVRQYGDDADLRQDLVGEIYCRFCDLLDAYDPTRGVPLRPYLARQLVASVYTYARRNWKKNMREISLEHDGETFEAPGADPTPHWDQRMLTEEVLEGLPAAIARLPVRQRQVVIWRYYDARSFEEIASVLKVRPATVRSLLRHGINNLRRQMSGGEPEPTYAD